jgi:hypothetical protein
LIADTYKNYISVKNYSAKTIDINQYITNIINELNTIDPSFKYFINIVNNNIEFIKTPVNKFSTKISVCDIPLENILLTVMQNKLMQDLDKVINGTGEKSYEKYVLTYPVPSVMLSKGTDIKFYHIIIPNLKLSIYAKTNNDYIYKLSFDIPIRKDFLSNSFSISKNPFATREKPDYTPAKFTEVKSNQLIDVLLNGKYIFEKIYETTNYKYYLTRMLTFIGLSGQILKYNKKIEITANINNIISELSKATNLSFNTYVINNEIYFYPL